MAVPLASLLHISWWVITAVIFVLLFIDALVFYQYGLGRASTPAISGEAEVFRVEEEAIRAAAAAIKERRSRFEAAEPAPADLVNPFR